MNFLDKIKVKKDKNGIWISKLNLSDEVKVSQKAWQEIYSFKDTIFKKDRVEFNNSKLSDHISYINKSYNFTKETIYLEIGCGPAYIGEYLMQKHGCHFVGVDFNYPFLVILKEYLEKKKFKNFTLIYADINDMPIKPNSINFLYGGGVIEHSKNTEKILGHFYHVMAPKGVSFNTVPAFNLWWVLRSWYSIPAVQPFRSVFEFIHKKLFKNSVLVNHYGYELSFTQRMLKNLHKKAGFKNICSGSFAFHPSSAKSSHVFLSEAYFKLSKNPLFAPLYYVYGKK
jgi:ubiquinone/menaquinone biosynthesis C-methylase UbiE